MKHINEFLHSNKLDSEQPMSHEEWEKWVKSHEDYKDHYVNIIWRHDISTAQKVKDKIYGMYEYNEDKDIFEKIGEYNWKEEVFHCKEKDLKKFGYQ